MKDSKAGREKYGGTPMPGTARPLPAEKPLEFKKIPRAELIRNFCKMTDEYIALKEALAESEQRIKELEHSCELGNFFLGELENKLASSEARYQVMEQIKKEGREIRFFDVKCSDCGKLLIYADDYLICPSCNWRGREDDRKKLAEKDKEIIDMQKEINDLNKSHDFFIDNCNKRNRELIAENGRLKKEMGK